MTEGLDFGCSLGVVVALLGLGAAYGARAFLRGEAHYARVDKEGSSALLGRRPMEMTYWGLQPIARACIALGVSANGVTAFSLVLAAATGVALGYGHFGVAAVCTALSSLADAVDGLVARESGTASDAGEVFDAAVDRYAELFFFAGLAFWFRESPLALGVVLAGLVGSFMVSYATAKAEALRVKPPRGSMRRPERAFYLGLGVTLAPLVAAARPAMIDVPVLLGVGVVALFANVSAVHRLRALAALVAGVAAPSPSPSPPPSPSPKESTSEQPAE